MRATSCFFAVVCVGLALAGPAKRLEERKASATASGLGDPIKEATGSKVDRAKKQASTTFCVEIRQNKPVKVDCDSLKPQYQPEPQPTPAPEPPTTTTTTTTEAPAPPAEPSPMYYHPQPTYYYVQPQVPNYQQFIVQPQQPIVQPQQPIVQPQQLVVRPMMQPSFVLPPQPTFHQHQLKPIFKPMVLPQVPVHQPNCPQPTGLECTCRGTSSALPASLLAKDVSGGASANPSNEALALKFLQDLQKNANSGSDMGINSQLAIAAPVPIISSPKQADPSSAEDKPSPLIMPMGMVPMVGNVDVMGPSANSFYDGLGVQHSIRLGREDSNVDAPVEKSDLISEEAPEPQVPSDATKDDAESPRVVRFLADENEVASNSDDEA